MSDEPISSAEGAVGDVLGRALAALKGKLPAALHARVTELLAANAPLTGTDIKNAIQKHLVEESSDGN